MRQRLDVSGFETSPSGRRGVFHAITDLGAKRGVKLRQRLELGWHLPSGRRAVVSCHDRVGTKRGVHDEREDRG
jgi:hypothetical protein